MVRYHNLSTDIWNKVFTDWFTKCSDGYTVFSWYNFIQCFLRLKPAIHRMGNSLNILCLNILGLESKMSLIPILYSLASCLTLTWRRQLPYRNQSIDLLRKSMNWFLYDDGLRHERVKATLDFISRLINNQTFDTLFKVSPKAKAIINGNFISLFHDGVIQRFSLIT